MAASSTGGLKRFQATIVQSAICRTTAKHRPQPTLFFFPGLSSKPFHDPQHFPWVPLLQDNVEVIRNEYLQLKANKVRSDYNEDGEHALHKGSWDWHSFMLKGRAQAEFAAHCPETTRILEHLIQGAYLMMGIPFSFAFFSTLHPKSHIAPHYGACNLRLRCHLPLLVPAPSASTSTSTTQQQQQPPSSEHHLFKTMEEAKADTPVGIRVGDEIRVWEEGSCLIFDDSYEHETWNTTDEDRVILLLDFWHPELTTGEREGIRCMFEYAKTQGWLK